MAGLPLKDWLQYAKRLPIGQTQRLRHQCPGRVRSTNATNMVVSNKQDRYVAYCQSCRKGGVEMKTHVRLVSVPDQHRFMPWPDDAVNWQDVEQAPALRALLLDKGIDAQVMCPDQVIWYSKRQQRLLFGTALGWIGRAAAGQSPKWTGYGYPSPAYHKHPADDWKDVWVVTEDYLSALKVRWATPEFTAVGLCGTAMPDALGAQLVKQQPTLVVTFMDGDKAGRDGAVRVAHRVRGLGFECVDIATPEGCDPKDLHQQQLRDLIHGAVNTARSARQAEVQDAARCRPD
jgi:hypothetical protein